jgi:hypothetical protein
MIIAGIDYSMTSPAICIFNTETEWKYDNCSFFFLTETKKYDVIVDNIVGSYFEYPTEIQRFDLISSFFLDRMLEREVSKVFLENYSLGSKGRVFNIAENTGILKYRMWNFGLEYETVPPTVIKKFATGKGNANKEKMQEFFIEETQIDLKSKLSMTEKQWNPSSDIIDAYWICKFGYQQVINKS